MKFSFFPRTPMRCSKCKNPETKVIDSREASEGRVIRRRRECARCGHRFTTFERVETTHLIVIKKDGSRQPYRREKLEQGIWRACEKRPVTKEQVEKLISGLEEKWSNNHREIPSHKIGEGVMKKLKKLDEVAYIRFASVYRQFKDVASFKQELKNF